MAKIVGIDLGTTHTVVAYAERDGNARARVLPIPQLVTPTEIEARPLLPSCLYAPLATESCADAWGDAPWVIGELARRRGAEVPGRMVASAKSWLCHPSVDRNAALLPWGAHDDAAPKISPVDASARLLAHVRRAWDDAFTAEPLDAQEIVLTVPASFDEVARELTVLAAERAGLRVRLLEEPQAAFYDFMQRVPASALPRGHVLVCDIGGGTTDLSLIRVHDDGSVERVAVGNHVLLGGDNMDLALATMCEPRMSGEKLDPARFAQLAAACRAAKERLLGSGAPDSVRVTVLRGGSKLVGGALSADLSREETERVVLDGFLPRVELDAKPERKKSALVAFGLPYERDVAITRHVAWFLARHCADGELPTAILLNGGVFRAKRIAERLTKTVSSWIGKPIVALEHPDPDLGVARGAVAYGLAREGRGARIESGAARGYYVGLGDSKAVCVVPRGAKEGVVHAARERTFALTIGRAARFELFASDDARVDAPGAIVAIDEERFRPLPPVATVFEASQKSGEINVSLEGELTPIGTLDLACVEAGAESPRRFRLAFQLRGDVPPETRLSSLPPPASIGTRKLDEARAAIDAAFGKPRADASGREAKDLLRELERILGERSTWTTGVARALFDAIAQGRGARRRSADHERLFWLLAGYCVRPGFGAPLDPQRTALLFPLFAERLAFPDQARGWQQFWIAWRRAAGGLDEAQQLAIRDATDAFLAPPEAGKKPPKKWKPQAEADLLDMASSLERVPATRRSELGGWILDKTWTDRDPRLWAAIGRIGARVPAYASAHHVVSPLVAERWLDHLLREKWDKIPTAALAAVQLARVTADRARDVNENVRREVAKRLEQIAAREDWVRAVREHVAVAESDRAAFFGEGLPVGLRLVE